MSANTPYVNIETLERSTQGELSARFNTSFSPNAEFGDWKPLTYGQVPDYEEGKTLTEGPIEIIDGIPTQTYVNVA